jgi:hypothetical protein
MRSLYAFIARMLKTALSTFTTILTLQEKKLTHQHQITLFMIDAGLNPNFLVEKCNLDSYMCNTPISLPS